MHQLTKTDLQKLNADLQHQPDAAVLSRAIQTNGINNAAKNPKVKPALNRVFSLDLKTKTITDQKHAGLCWMFAALNFLRHYFIKEYHVKNFELSSNYLFFWDKIERANVFFDHVIQTANRSTYDRSVDLYLNFPDDDGGEWDMAVSLIEKYGLMPANAFPRTKAANNTDDLNAILGLKMRRDAVILRHSVQNHDSDVKKLKDQMMNEIYRITAESLGTPPEKFNLEYRDNKKRKGNHDSKAGYHFVANLTPLDFYRRYFKGVHLDDYVPLTNYPDKKMNQLYRQKSGDNVEGGRDIHFLNVPMKVLKKTAIAQMKDGWGVWFGNDVLEQENQNQGYLDGKLYQRAKLFHVDLSMTKKERFQYLEAESSHAMTFVGVDLVYDQPTKWKVENSWGAKVGESGYFVMSDDWMDKYVYEVIVNKKYLTKQQQKLLHMKPIELKPWE